jgi:hypothetical protein
MERLRKCLKGPGKDPKQPVKFGKRREKKWGAIFTCLNSRAIHIELASSLSTDSAIRDIKRFRGRTGALKKIYCDNGTNFRNAETELPRSLLKLDGDRLNCEFAEADIKWKLKPP